MTNKTPQGNQYDHRDYGAGAENQNSYHYSNKYVSPELPCDCFIAVNFIGLRGFFFGRTFHS